MTIPSAASGAATAEQRSDAGTKEAPAESYTTAGVLASLLEYLHACPICEGTELAHYSRVPSLFRPNQYIHYERCRGCGTVLRNPRLPEGYRISRYAETVLPEERKRLVPRKQLHYRYISRELCRLLGRNSPAKLLDFGCGAGGFLVAARDQGFDVAGLELNRDLARHVQDCYDIPTFAGLIADPHFPFGPFDVIASFQVFEHLVDPRTTLSELLRHLSPGGLISIEVPNLGATRERLRPGTTMDDSHLFYFDDRSLPLLLRRAGLDVVRIEQGVRPHRLLGDRARRVPRSLLRFAERSASFLRLRTSLTVIARAPR